MTTITYETALKALTEVVEEFGPDTTYEKVARANGIEYDTLDWKSHCQYATQDGKPLCLVGQVIHRLGFKFPRDEYGNIINLVARRYLVEQFEAGFTPDAIDLLARAQGAQDGGTTWGKALEHAKAAL